MSDLPPVYVAPPETCVTLTDLSARSGGTFAATGEPAAFNYPLPPHASAELREYLRPQADAAFPAPGIARLPGARVFGAGSILSPDGRLLARDVSLDFGKPFEEHWLRTFAKIRPAEKIPGSLAVIATTLGQGYSHWLLEELPRLLALPRAGCDALLAHATAPAAREALARWGFTGKLIEPKRHGHLTADELVVPTLGWPAPASLAALRDFAFSLPGEKPARGECLFVSRATARRRQVTNESELWAQLEPRGFERVALEAMTWADQIATFRRARVVVAPHGAGLANLVFCAPDARVVEFFDRRYLNACYWKIAAVGQLDYRPVVPAGDSPLAQESVANREDLAADVPAILRALVAI